MEKYHCFIEISILYSNSRLRDTFPFLTKDETQCLMQQKLYIYIYIYNPTKIIYIYIYNFCWIKHCVSSFVRNGNVQEFFINAGLRKKKTDVWVFVFLNDFFFFWWGVNEQVSVNLGQINMEFSRRIQDFEGFRLSLQLFQEWSNLFS